MATDLNTNALFYTVFRNRTRFSLSSHILAAALQPAARNRCAASACNAAAGVSALTVVNSPALSLTGKWGQTAHRAPHVNRLSRDTPVFAENLQALTFPPMVALSPDAVATTSNII
jgi:hypothetical protein